MTLKFHAYADDSQLYMHCHRDDIPTSTAHLSQCVVDIGHWMAANRLQMNPAKTELLWAGTKHNVSLLGCHAPTLQLGSDIVTPSKHVRVLGVHFGGLKPVSYTHLTLPTNREV